MIDKIKVMHFVSGLQSGGVEQMLYNYCSFMNKEEYEFIIVYQHVADRACLEKMEEIGCKCIKVTARNENFVKNIIEYNKLIKNYKPDIVHAHMNMINFFALIPAFFNGVKVRISHSHTCDNRNFIYNTIISFFNFLNRLFSNHWYTCGEEAGIFMYGKKNMAKQKVKTIENAIDIDSFKKNNIIKEEFKRKYNIENKFIVGHIGRFAHPKNHDRLLHIFKELLNINKQSILLLVGSGEKEEEVKELVKVLGIEKNVIFYGTTNKANELYSVMDVFVLPSLYEGFPVVSIEVQAADVPSIFSDCVTKKCRITDAIKFMSLEEKDETWANEIIKTYQQYLGSDLSSLKQKYDIKVNANILDNYYKQALKR